MKRRVRGIFVLQVLFMLCVDWLPEFVFRRVRIRKLFLCCTNSQNSRTVGLRFIKLYIGCLGLASPTFLSLSLFFFYFAYKDVTD
jgi:hypothetical protein